MGTVEWLGIVRFLHILSGITWIGLLYYLNVVQVPSFAAMELAARQQAIARLVPRAMLWFRYAALSTVTFGIIWIIVNGHIGDFFKSSEGKSISVGGFIGILMFLNVWAIIWPNWKKVIDATTATLEQSTPAPPEQATWATTARLYSRLNVLLSIPMLFFMIAAHNIPGLWG